MIEDFSDYVERSVQEFASDIEVKRAQSQQSNPAPTPEVTSFQSKFTETSIPPPNDQRQAPVFPTGKLTLQVCIDGEKKYVDFYTYGDPRDSE